MTKRQKKGKKTGILIQARLSSSRLPGKMLMEIGGFPLVEYVYKRCLHSRGGELVAILTSVEKSDDPLFDFCSKKRIPVFRGSLDNVLERYVRASEEYGLDYVVRVCGDSPFVDVSLMDKMIKKAHEDCLDYVSAENVVDGFLSEVVSGKTLKAVLEQTDKPLDLEHVTLYIRHNMDKFKSTLFNVEGDVVDNGISITVDTIDDLWLCGAIAQALMPGKGCDGFDFIQEDVMRAIHQGENNAGQGGSNAGAEVSETD